MIYIYSCSPFCLHHLLLCLHQLLTFSHLKSHFLLFHTYDSNCFYTFTFIFAVQSLLLFKLMLLAFLLVPGLLVLSSIFFHRKRLSLHPKPSPQTKILFQFTHTTYCFYCVDESSSSSSSSSQSSSSSLIIIMDIIINHHHGHNH